MSDKVSQTKELGVTEYVAHFAATISFDDLPPETIELARRCVLDGLAVMLAGTREPCARIIQRYLRELAGVQEASVIGVKGLQVPMHLAALANGTAGHALDWDDTAMSLEKDRSVLIHPTMPPLSAGLAVSEKVGAGGCDLITAFILGFEVEVKIAEAIHPDHFTGARGFHSSGTIGVFGATVAAGRLLRLSPERMRNALSIAATMASGLGVNHGTMSKPLNMGRAAENGVTAARLASMGFDGARNALEGGRGFFEAFGGGYEQDRIFDRLGAPWAIVEPGTSIKPYPSGVVGHPGMDAMKKLVEFYDIAPEDVEHVLVRTGPNVIEPGPLRIKHANAALEAKFCLAFQMAAMILRRNAGLAEFQDDFVQSEACQAMQRRVEAIIDPEIAALGKDRVVFEITIVTRDGKSLTQRSDEHYRGGPRNPLEWLELCDKLHDCAADTLDANARRSLVDLVGRLEALESLSELISATT